MKRDSPGCHGELYVPYCHTIPLPYSFCTSLLATHISCHTLIVQCPRLISHLYSTNSVHLPCLLLIILHTLTLSNDLLTVPYIQSEVSILLPISMFCTPLSIPLFPPPLFPSRSFNPPFFRTKGQREIRRAFQPNFALVMS